MEPFILVIGAGFIAGAMNALAGGGTVLTFPVLLAAGVSPVAANATNAVALVPGSLSGGWGFRVAAAISGNDELKTVSRYLVPAGPLRGRLDGRHARVSESDWRRPSIRQRGQMAGRTR